MILLPQGTGIGGAQTKTVRKSVPINNFNTSASCSLSTQFPTIVPGSITIPVASDIPACPINYLDVVSKTKFNMCEFSFTGTIVGGITAPIGSDEIAMFATTDITNFTSQEFGWVFTLNDNTLKGYVQNGNGQPGGVSLFQFVVIDLGDGLQHYYTARVTKTNGTNTFLWYIDNILQASLDILLIPNYFNLPYYIVGTTHRTEGGWDSDAEQLVINNIDYIYNI